jgi:hypothetical protein
MGTGGEEDWERQTVGYLYGTTPSRGWGTQRETVADGSINDKKNAHLLINSKSTI